LVARQLWELDAASSSLATPTIFYSVAPAGRFASFLRVVPCSYLRFLQCGRSPVDRVFFVVKRHDLYGEAIRLEDNARLRQTMFLVVVMFFWCAQYVYNPFFTVYLEALGIGASMIGLIVGSYGFMQMMVRIPSGLVADLFDVHRLFITLGLTLPVAANLILYYWKTPMLFLLARVLSGISASTWLSFVVYFSRFSIVDDANRNMGMLMAADHGGILIAFIIGGFLHDRIGIRFLFLISGIIALMGFVLFLPLKAAPIAAPKPMQLSDLLPILKNRRLLNCSFLAGMLQIVTFATSMSFTANYARSLGANGIELGLSSGIMTFASIAAAWCIGAGHFRNINDKLMVVLGFIMLVVYCVGIPLSGSLFLLYIFQSIGGFGRSMLMTILMSNAVKYISPKQRSTAMGVYQSIYSLGMTLGPIMMGGMLDLSGSFLISFLFIATVPVVGLVWTLLSSFSALAVEES
jgi:MFS family permease